MDDFFEFEDPPEDPFRGEDAASESKPIEEAVADLDPEVGMSWRHVEGGTILHQLGAIYDVARFHSKAIQTYTDLVEEGLDIEAYKLPVTLSSHEKSVVSLGLHLVGFFAPELGALAGEAMHTLETAQNELGENVTDAQKENIAAAVKRLSIRRTAEALGIPRDEFEAMQDDLRQAEPGIWEHDEDPEAA